MLRFNVDWQSIHNVFELFEINARPMVCMSFFVTFSCVFPFNFFHDWQEMHFVRSY